MVRSDSPTQRLSYQLQDNFTQAEHIVPLLSLENSYDADDLKEWDKSLHNVLSKHIKLNAANERNLVEDISQIA